MKDLDWNLEYDGAAPPLPEYLDRPKKERGGSKKAEEWLEPGAYLLLYDAEVVGEKDLKLPNFFAGILRIDHKKERGSDKLSGSADIYTCPWEHVGNLGLTSIKNSLSFEQRARNILKNLKGHKPPARLAMFQLPRRDYRYYFRLESMEVYSRLGRSKLRVGIDTHKYVPEGEYKWERAQPLTIALEAKPPVVGAQKARFCGISNSLGTRVGRVFICRLAERCRLATVRYHVEPTLNPLVKEEIWDKYLEGASWFLDLKRGQAVERAGAGEWTIEELKSYHERVIDQASSTDKGTEPWLYNLLVVGQIEGNRLGQMYDYGDDSDTDPEREGAAVAANQMVNIEGIRGAKRLGECEEAFNWTAVHEFGHMQGLYHNPAGGVMQPRGRSFESSIEREYHEDDRRRLIHLPDLWVRPGGVPFGHRYRETPISVLDLLPKTETLRLEIARPEVAQGRGPRELVVRLTNRSRSNLVLCPFPDETVLETERLGVNVLTPAGRSRVVRGVRPPQPLESQHSYPLSPLETLEYRLPWTEARGFFESGQYRLQAHLCWAVKHKRRVPKFYRASNEVSFKV